MSKCTRETLCGTTTSAQEIIVHHQGTMCISRVCFAPWCKPGGASLKGGSQGRDTSDTSAMNFGEFVSVSVQPVLTDWNS